MENSKKLEDDGRIEIIKGIEIIGKALWIKRHKMLVIGDLHIGYEEALAKEGVSVPRFQFMEMKKDLMSLIERTRPKRIIINGDLKHEFGDISEQEWNEALEILDMLLESCEEVILIRGNHDKILEPIAEKRGLNIADFHCLKEEKKRNHFDIPIKSICFLHGDKVIKNKEVESSEILIIGHEHPAITLREGGKAEKYKCFLVGKYKNQSLIVIPSFFSLIEGADVNNEKLLSPYLHQDIGNFDVYVVGDRTYKFGKLKTLD